MATQTGQEEGKNKDGETTWWRIEERHGLGMPKTDRGGRCLNRGIQLTEVEQSETAGSLGDTLRKGESLCLFLMAHGAFPNIQPPGALLSTKHETKQSL